MAEIRVHLEDVLIIVLQSPFESSYISGAKSEFAAPFHDVELVCKLVFHQILHDIGGTIGRAVINYQYVEIISGQGEHCTDNGFDVLLLVVGRYNYKAVARVHFLICFGVNLFRRLKTAEHIAKIVIIVQSRQSFPPFL